MLNPGKTQGGIRPILRRRERAVTSALASYARCRCRMRSKTTAAPDHRGMSNAGAAGAVRRAYVAGLAVPVIHQEWRRFCRVKAYVTTRCACNLHRQFACKGQQRQFGDNTMGQSKIKKR